MIYVFVDNQCVEQNANPAPPPLEAFRQKYGDGATVVDIPDETPFLGVPRQHLHLVDGVVSVDPAYEPPEPQPDPLAALQGNVARLEETVKKTIPVSPHDKRFLAQKEIGKTMIAWIKANPACTPQEVEDHVMAQVLAELPGQPVVPKLYWEWTDPATGQVSPQGLAMSYCYEAVVRGYLPPEAPVSWPTLVQLIVATPEEQVAAWLRSL